MSHSTASKYNLKKSSFDLDSFVKCKLKTKTTAKSQQENQKENLRVFT